MKCRSASIVFGIVVLLFRVDSVRSADVPSTNAPITLPEITVVGRPLPESLTSPPAASANQQKTQIPGGYTVRTSVEMQKGRASSFQDLLQGVPGLFMQTENGMEITKVSIRGSGIESEDEPLGVEFLLDGLTFNQGDGEAIIEDFDVSTLKCAQIYRGADAFKYGSMTLGGAINLIPFTGYDADPFQIQMEGGSFGFVRGQASSAGVEGPWDYYASVSGRARDGYREHSQENTEIFFSDFGYKISEHLENRFYVTLDQTDRNLPGAVDQATMQNDPTKADPEAILLDYKKQWYYMRVADKITYDKDGHEFDAGVYYWHRDLVENGFYAPDDPQQGIQKYHADNGGADVNSVTHGELFGQQNLLTMGINPTFEREADNNYQNLLGQQGASIARDIEISINLPFYLENQHYLTEKLSVLTGFQLACAIRNFQDQFNDTVSGDQSHQQEFYAINPKIGMLYEINDQDQVYVNFSRAWQPPSFDNMVDFGDDPGASLEYTPLDPQISWTVEVGTRGEQGRFDWDLSLYYAWLHDELLDVNDALGNDRGAVNINHSYHAGIEAEFDVELWNSKKIKDEAGQRVNFNQTYTLNDFHFQNDPVYGDNRLGGIPVMLYEMNLMYEAPGGFYAGPNLQCNLTPYPVDQQNTMDAEPYVLLGFKTGYVFNIGKSKVSAFVQATNLTDERYAAAVDPVPDAQNPPDPQIFHPGDGRAFYGGVSCSW